jgi:hypothetical protein
MVIAWSLSEIQMAIIEWPSAAIAFTTVNQVQEHVQVTVQDGIVYVKSS